MNITLPPDYRPTDDEDFMNPVMTEYFRQMLLKWRHELLDASQETLSNLQEGGILEPDIADRASIETDRSLELRTRDRARKLIGKIDEALERIDDGSYGYCEETHEPDRCPPVGGAPHRDDEHRGPGASRTHGAHPSRGLTRPPKAHDPVTLKDESLGMPQGFFFFGSRY